MSRRVISAVTTTNASRCAGAATETMTAVMSQMSTTAVSNNAEMILCFRRLDKNTASVLDGKKMKYLDLKRQCTQKSLFIYPHVIPNFCVFLWKEIKAKVLGKL